MDAQRSPFSVRTLAEVARALYSDVGQGVPSALESITREVVAIVPGADSADITLVQGRKGLDSAEAAEATDDAAIEFSRLQLTFKQGPCLDAALQEQIVHVTDYTTETRWLELAPAVVEHTPIRSSVSYQLFTHEQEMGSLNVYAFRPDAFTEDAIETGYSFATHAALMLDSSRRSDNFDAALASRDVIGQAKGILVERYGVSSARAFDMLVHLSQQQNVAVKQLARELVALSQPTS